MLGKIFCLPQEAIKAMAMRLLKTHKAIAPCITLLATSFPKIAPKNNGAMFMSPADLN
jgi:hypothetical protein